MSSKNRERNQTGDFLVLLASLLLTCAGWIFVRIPSDYRAEVAFRAKALQTVGIITQMDQHMVCTGYGCFSSCNMRVEFKNTEGRILRFWTYCQSSINKTVPVWYSPDQSDGESVQATIDSAGNPEHQARARLLFCLCLGLLGSWILSYGNMLSSE